MDETIDNPRAASSTALSRSEVSRQIRDLINSPCWPALPPDHRGRWLQQLHELSRQDEN